ncbi:MAG: DUF72 domain-containing protein [Halobacteriota archaeon]
MHWRGVFYQQGADLLTQYARSFDSVEANSTFYRFPTVMQLQKWDALTPDHFVFAIKMNRHITHTKRLRNVQRSLSDFLTICSVLEQKLGPILIQLPVNFEKNLERFDEFLNLLPEHRFAFEFRNDTWLQHDVLQRLQERSNIAIVTLGSQFRDKAEDSANFTYIRWHGRGGALDAYSHKEIDYWAHSIQALSKKADVFGYWNNDVHGYAPKNCLELKRKIGC